eukprot:scaffold9408_cov99-Amphora_coffeaeformis.AAC.2
MSQASDLATRFRVGSILFVKASQVLHAGDLGRYYGSRAAKMWLPGRVNACDIKESKGGYRTTPIYSLPMRG